MPTGIVEEVTCAGVSLRLIVEGNIDGEAWLPSSEWSWNNRDWDSDWESIEIGQIIDVAVVNQPCEQLVPTTVSARRFDGKLAELSWTHQARAMVVDSFSSSQIWGHVGEVEVSMSYQAYMNSLGRALPRRLQDHSHLAAGDRIGGIAVGARDADGFIQLDPAEYLSWRRDEIALNQTLRQSSHEATADTGPGIIALPTISEETRKAISPVLLLEDNDGCRATMTELLRGCGVEVKAVATIPEAHLALQERISSGKRADDYRMAIIDPNLSDDGEDHAGLKFARELNMRGNCRIVLVSGEAQHERKVADYGSLRVCLLISKPFYPHSFLPLIETAAALSRSVPLKDLIEAETGVVSASESNSYQCTESTTLDHLLRGLVDIRAGTIAHVFEVHPRSHDARSIGRYGRGLDWEAFRGKIGKSPIKDAALGRDVLVENVSETKRSHLWTRSMMNYESFCGIPMGMIGPYAHVLVAFHAEKNAFGQAFRQEARVCAERCARLIEQRLLRTAGEHHARWAATGLALQSTAHELRNQLVFSAHKANEIQSQLSGAKNQDDSALGSGAVTNASQLAGSIYRMVETVQLLMGVGGERTLVPITRCLEQAITGCREYIRLAGGEQLKHRTIVADVVRGNDEGLRVRAIPGALVIVFLNLYLNAAQQMQDMSSIRRVGLVEHTLDRRLDHKGKPWAYVRIRDTGPGIHRDDWGRVFDPGYTTREGGTGLGLYLCKHLLDNISEHGRTAGISVTRSVLWDGTTITVKLPLPL